MNVAPVLSRSQRDRRWAAVRAMMDEHDVEGLLIGSYRGRERHEAYVLDDELDGCVVFPLNGEPTVLTWSTTFLSRTAESAARGADVWVEDSRLGRTSEDVASLIVEHKLAESRVGVVGLSATSPGEIEGTVPYTFWANVLEQLPDTSFVDLTLPYTDLWLVRDDEELALLRYAATVSERAVEAMAAAARPGVTEAEVYAAIIAEVYRNGCALKYPYLSLQSGPASVGWGAPRWTLRAESPRVLERGDMVQAEIHTCYGGMEAQVQGAVALDPVSDVLRRCEAAARRSYEAGLDAVRPGVRFRDLLAAMERPLAEAGCWSKTPLVHTLTFGATGFTAVGREQLWDTREAGIETRAPSSRRLDLVLQPGMPLELEPNASMGTHRVNIGGVVIVTESGCEPLNELSTRVQHVA